jgi:hypothetical protein
MITRTIDCKGDGPNPPRSDPGHFLELFMELGDQRPTFSEELLCRATYSCSIVN